MKVCAAGSLVALALVALVTTGDDGAAAGCIDAACGTANCSLPGAGSACCAPCAQVGVFSVAVETKVSGQHPDHGTGSALGYVVDGVQAPPLNLTIGRTYRFAQDDATNQGHPLGIYTDIDKTHALVDGVSAVGEPGRPGAYTELTVPQDAPPLLYYQCTLHSRMGGALRVSVL
tara:strand:- start:895 stop:1416 length:522 start_codon:yes stop_codon:yes gene_type:complete